MLNTPILTNTEIQTFQNDGFLILRGAFDTNDMVSISSWCDEMIKRPEVSGTHWVYHEKNLVRDADELVNRIENIAPFHEGFRELTEILAKPVGQLLNEEAVLFKRRLILRCRVAMASNHIRTPKLVGMFMRIFLSVH